MLLIIINEITLQKLILQKKIFPQIPSQKVTFLNLLTEIIIGINIIIIVIGPGQGTMIELDTPPSIMTPSPEKNDIKAVPAALIPAPPTRLLPEVLNLPVTQDTTIQNPINPSR